MAAAAAENSIPIFDHHPITLTDVHKRYPDIADDIREACRNIHACIMAIKSVPTVVNPRLPLTPARLNVDYITKNSSTLKTQIKYLLDFIADHNDVYEILTSDYIKLMTAVRPGTEPPQLLYATGSYISYYNYVPHLAYYFLLLHSFYNTYYNDNSFYSVNADNNYVRSTIPFHYFRDRQGAPMNAVRSSAEFTINEMYDYIATKPVSGYLFNYLLYDKIHNEWFREDPSVIQLKVFLHEKINAISTLEDINTLETELKRTQEEIKTKLAFLMQQKKRLLGARAFSGELAPELEPVVEVAAQKPKTWGNTFGDFRKGARNLTRKVLPKCIGNRCFRPERPPPRAAAGPPYIPTDSGLLGIQSGVSAAMAASALPDATSSRRSRSQERSAAKSRGRAAVATTAAASGMRGRSRPAPQKAGGYRKTQRKRRNN
jgi:hypothetical protein